MSKQILIENNKIEIPGHGTLVYSNPKAEIKLETIRPDVSAFFEETPIYFEIKVTHGVDSEKEFFLLPKNTVPLKLT